MARAAADAGTPARRWRASSAEFGTLLSRGRAVIRPEPRLGQRSRDATSRSGMARAPAVGAIQRRPAPAMAEPGQAASRQRISRRWCRPVTDALHGRDCCWLSAATPRPDLLEGPTSGACRTRQPLRARNAVTLMLPLQTISTATPEQPAGGAVGLVLLPRHRRGLGDRRGATLGHGSEQPLRQYRGRINWPCRAPAGVATAQMTYSCASTAGGAAPRSTASEATASPASKWCATNRPQRGIQLCWRPAVERRGCGPSTLREHRRQTGASCAVMRYATGQPHPGTTGA